MNRKTWYFIGVFYGILLAQVPSAVRAARPSETLLPATTKGYISISRLAEFEKRFDQTQFGQLLLDPTMRPFRESLENQLEDEWDMVREKLGFTLSDLDRVTSGELSLALIDREDQEAALAITIEIGGDVTQVQRLLSIVEENFSKRGGRKGMVRVGRDELTIFSVPSRHGKAAQQTVYYTKQNMLVGIDDLPEAEAMLKRFSDDSGSLGSVKAFAIAMERCGTEAGALAPEVRWFVDPFGFVWSWRTLERDPPSAKRDMAKILYETGFDAIQGVAGYVNLLVKPQFEWVHRTCVYAPPVAGKESDRLRWNSSMRMLQTPNVDDLTPEPWVPRMAATYATISLDVSNAFDNVKWLFDAMYGYEDAFETTMEGFELDAYGPKIKMKAEFVKHMDNRVSMLTHYKTPITPESERYIYAVKAADAEMLAAGLRKFMENDPLTVEHKVGDVVVWEVVESEIDINELQLDAPLGPLHDKFGVDDMEEEEHLFPNSAACVADGYLLLASDIDFLRETLAATALSERLINSLDHIQVEEALRKLAPGKLSGWSFARLDESYRPTYELLRQGRMPESKTTVGRLLNEILTTEEEADQDVLRKQELDASKLPSFEMVRRYFGPSGRVLQSDEDGWFITGAQINKEAE